MTASVDADASNRDLVIVPGVSRRVTIARPGMWTGARVYVDGQLAQRGSWGKWLLTGDDGRQIAVRVGEDLTGPVLTAGKERIAFGPRIPAWLGVLAFVPLFLLVIGGALGGAVGATGTVVNRGIARLPISNGSKAGAMFGVAVLSFGIVLVLATLLQLGVDAARR
jgi:hypothetical protein